MILRGQEFTFALESYFELAFCFQTKYPKGSSGLLHIIQTRIAGYGDPNAEDGRLTILRKDPLMTRVAKYTHIADH